MRNLLLAVLALAACKSTDQEPRAKTPGPAAPRFGRITAIWEVVDKAERSRVGFVETWRYDDGRSIYWVRGPRREIKHGYILGNNAAYKYVWYAGQRTEEAEAIGADTISANARRILGYDRPVELQETSLEALLRELRGDGKKGGAGAPADEDGDGDE